MQTFVTFGYAYTTLNKKAMTLSPALSKFTLTAHVTFSVGWLGAVAGFLALAMVGLIGQDIQVVRSSYVSMELMGWFVIVPFCISALLTGFIQSVGTPWGLFKHYWILIKLILTVVATIMLFIHLQPVGYVSSVAADKMFTSADLRGLRIQLIADAGVALFVLLVATALSIYKPWGKIQFPNRDQFAKVSAYPTKTKRPWGLYVMVGLISTFVLVVILHLFGISLGGHH